MSAMDFFWLGVLVLAAARATYLVSDDAVPFGYLRDWLEEPSKSKPWNSHNRRDKFRIWLFDGMSCTHCMSVHTGFWATVLATYTNWIPVNGWGDWPYFMVTWFGIAGLVVLLESLHFWLLGNVHDHDDE